jgi:hypothetical protein
MVQFSFVESMDILRDNVPFMFDGSFEKMAQFDDFLNHRTTILRRRGVKRKVCGPRRFRTATIGCTAAADVAASCNGVALGMGTGQMQGVL